MTFTEYRLFGPLMIKLNSLCKVKLDHARLILIFSPNQVLLLYSLEILD
jgi:hypothetical protein